MEMQLQKISRLLIILFLFVQCKGQNDQPVKNTTKIKDEKIADINFLDAKYKSFYTLDAENEMPVMSYNDEKVGQFTVYYVGKTKELQDLWKNFDSKIGLFYEDSPDEKYLTSLNKAITYNLIVKDYEIFVAFILPKFIKIQNSELIYNYPYQRQIFKLNKKTNKWLLIKEDYVKTGEDVLTLAKLHDLNKSLSSNKLSKTNDEENDDLKYQKILLYKFIQSEINAKNVDDETTTIKIENVLKYYISQKDFYKAAFFQRESEIIDGSVDQSKLQVWFTLQEKLNFINVVDENLLFDDWSYPFRQIPSIQYITKLYDSKNADYGHIYENNALPQQIALSLYFKSWDKRKKVYQQIDEFKSQISKVK